MPFGPRLNIPLTYYSLFEVKEGPFDETKKKGSVLQNCANPSPFRDVGAEKRSVFCMPLAAVFTRTKYSLGSFNINQSINQYDIF